MFKFNTITGNGTAQEILNMPSELEGCIHSVNFFNNNGSNETIVFDVGGKSFSHFATVGASNFGFKINIPSSTSVKVTAPSGVEIAISYIEQAIDASAGLNNIQQAAANAEASLQALVTQAENHVANLPDGTINDIVAGDSTTYSSNKINSELSNKADSTHEHDSVINDSAAGDSTTYSSNKINTELSAKSGTDHVHDASKITSGTLNHARMPNATSSTVGGLKVRLSGTTAYFTTNGSNA